MLQHLQLFFSFGSMKFTSLKSFIILAVLRCDEFAVPISMSQRQGNTATCVDVEAVVNRLQCCVVFGRPNIRTFILSHTKHSRKPFGNWRKLAKIKKELAEFRTCTIRLYKRHYLLQQKNVVTSRITITTNAPIDTNIQTSTVPQEFGFEIVQLP